MRVAIPGIWIGCPSGGVIPSDIACGARHLAGLVAETSDVVLVLNETEGAMAGCPAILAGNLLLQAVQIRVHEPGKHRINFTQTIQFMMAHLLPYAIQIRLHTSRDHETQ